MVGIGIGVPDYAEAQFKASQPWHIERGLWHRIVGGHCVPIVSRDDEQTAGLFTWGGKTGITEPFYRKFNNVAVVAFTEEMSKATRPSTGLTARS